MAAWDDPEGCRRSLERKLSRVQALVKPGWHVNRGYLYDTSMEAYAAGRNDFIDRIREALEDQ